MDAANDGVPETSVGAVPANLARPRRRQRHRLHVLARARPAPTCTTATRKRTSTCRWACTARWSSTIRTDPAAAPAAGHRQGRDAVRLEVRQGLRPAAESRLDTRSACQSEQAGRIGAGARLQPGELQAAVLVPQRPVVPQHHPRRGRTGGQFNWADWIAAHPGYDPLITGSISAGRTAGHDRRQGPDAHDQHGLRDPAHAHARLTTPRSSAPTSGPGRGPTIRRRPDGGSRWPGLEKNTLTIGSGETYDWLIDLASRDSPRPTRLARRRATTRPHGLPAAQQQAQPYQSGDPGLRAAPTYIGGPTVRDGPAQSGLLRACQASQFFPFHNHDDYKATNNGVYPGGMFTMIMPTP